MTAYRVGDVPAGLDVFDVPAYVPVADYNAAAGVLTGPDGEDVALTGATFTIGDQTEEADPDADLEPIVTVDWGTESPFATVGRYLLTITLTNTGVQQTLPAYPVIVETEDGWLTIESLRQGWVDAPTDDDDCFELLEVSKNDVIAYAPVLGVDDLVPARYRKAQRMQARNTWNAAKVAPSGDLGSDSFTITPHPLDWAIKQVLGPKPAIPPVG